MNRTKLLEILKRYKSLHAKRYGIVSLGLFGSYARGEATSVSDVDIILQTLTPDPYNIVHIKEDLEQQLNLPVDVVRMRARMNPFLKERIEKEAVYV